MIHDISAKISKTFLFGKYSNFNFQNRGYFGQKNIPQISWNLGHGFFIERWFTILRQKISKKISSGKKSNLNFQNRGYFGKKIFCKFLQTSVIISLKRGYLRYFSKIFHFFLSWQKSNFKFQNRGYFGKNNIPRISRDFGHNSFI